jgi:hypothetical protein
VDESFHTDVIPPEAEVRTADSLSIHVGSADRVQLRFTAAQGAFFQIVPFEVVAAIDDLTLLEQYTGREVGPNDPPIPADTGWCARTHSAGAVVFNAEGSIDYDSTRGHSSIDAISERCFAFESTVSGDETITLRSMGYERRYTLHLVAAR